MADLTIRELTQQSYENSRGHGFWDGPEQDNVPTKIALIHSEVSEMLESYRDPASDEMVKVPVTLVERLLDGGNEADVPAALRELAEVLQKWDAKPKGFDIELADALIRLFDLAGRLGIDLDAALHTKADYNRGREFMHGRRV